MTRPLLGAALALTLSACALNPETIGRAAVGHAQFASLSMAVSDCLGERQDVRDRVTPAWNRLVDKWAAADDLPRDERLIVALAGARSEVAEAKTDWSFIRAEIAAAGVDCGPHVRGMAENIETTFGEIESAILGDQRAVYVLEWASLLSAVLQGRTGEVVRL